MKQKCPSCQKQLPVTKFINDGGKITIVETEACPKCTAVVKVKKTKTKRTNVKEDTAN